MGKAKAHLQIAAVITFLTVLTGAGTSVKATPVLSGLRLWLDATDGTTVTDAFGRPPEDVGFADTVKQWTDKSGNGIIAIAPDSNQPSYSSTDFNGRATVIFDTDQFFDLTTSITTSEDTIFIVTRMFDDGDNRGPWIGMHNSALGLLNDNNRYLFETTGGNFLIASPAPTTNTIVVSRRSSGITTIFENGLPVIHNATGASGNSVIDSMGVYIRGLGPQPRTFYGVISELLVYDRVLSDFEMNKVGSYLAAKYDLNTTYPNTEGVETLSPAILWLGLKNSDDQGTSFDLKTEVYINDTIISDGIARCITGVTRNPSRAKEIAVSFGPVADNEFEPGDILSLKVFTRIGTNPNDSKCPGHNNAVGLRVYYDAVSRPSRFGAEIAPEPLTDLFLHTDGTKFLDDMAPMATTATFQDSSSLNFSRGNSWKEIGTWMKTMP